MATHPPAACTSSTCQIRPPPARSRSMSPTTRPACTGTCCCAGGTTCWAAPCGSSPGARPAASVTWCSASAQVPVPAERAELIAYGPLLSDDGTAWLGTAVLVRAPTVGAARAVLTAARYADVEVHDWCYGGRPSSAEGG